MVFAFVVCFLLAQQEKDESLVKVAYCGLSGQISVHSGCLGSCLPIYLDRSGITRSRAVYL
jgi:hypothetical protein